jgi:hypothetical protein
VTKRKKIVARRRGKFYGDEDQPQSDGATRWYAYETPEECAEAAWTWVDRLRSYHSQDAMMDLIYDAIYRGRPVGSNNTLGAQYLQLRSGVLINLNVIMSIVDTAVARFSKRRPFPVISASDAGYTEKGFAEEASRVLRRKLGSPALERANPRVLRDMCIRGDGVMKAFVQDGDVAYKRIPIYEVMVDLFEAENNDIRTWAHCRPEPRDVMLKRYPAFSEEIACAPAYAPRDSWSLFTNQQKSLADSIEVRELWHLPTSPDAEDGLHVVTIRGSVVRSRMWCSPRPPIQRCQWTASQRGFRGGGLVEQLAGPQEQINDILKDAREGLKHGSTLTIFLPRGSNVNKHHLKKRHPAVVEHDGAEPHYVAPNPVSNQALEIAQMLISQMYQISGVSQMAASSKNPLGAGASGKALDSMDDLQSERFAHVEADYQQYRVELGATTIDLAKDIAAEASGDLEPHFDQGEDVIEKKDVAEWIAEIEWDKVEIDGGPYHLILEPINYLADARGGRLAQVGELKANGMIPNPAIQADLFNEPDIQRANRTILGPKHKLDRIMSDLPNLKIPMMDISPDQFTNLDLGIEMALGELNEAEAQRNTPPAVLDRYREWINLAREQKKLRIQEAAPTLAQVDPTMTAALPPAMPEIPQLPGGGGPMPQMPPAGAPPMPPPTGLPPGP